MIDPYKIPSPAFVIEEDLLEKNLRTLDYVQHESRATIILALKGFAMYGVFGKINKVLKGVTASSLHEARLGYEDFGGEVHAYCPVYFEDDFAEMLKYCSHFTFNSLSQWEKYKSQVSQSAKIVSCGLRINPEYSEIKTDLYNPAGPGSRLGVPAYQLENGLPEGIEGLHFHSLFENNSDVLERTLRSIEEKFGHLFSKIKWLNMGGGHGITQKTYDLNKLIGLIKDLKSRYNFEVILEPGSAVAWETGSLVSTVVDIVENHGKKTAMLDVSFSAHMPDCIEMPYKPRIRGAWDASEMDQYVYSMGGTSCLAGDVMHGYAFNKPLKIGDKILFEDMIHYTMVKTTTFNGVKHPSIGMWTKNGKFELFKKFGYGDFKGRLS